MRDGAVMKIGDDKVAMFELVRMAEKMEDAFLAAHNGKGQISTDDGA